MTPDKFLLHRSNTADFSVNVPFGPKTCPVRRMQKLHQKFAERVRLRRVHDPYFAESKELTEIRAALQRILQKYLPDSEAKRKREAYQRYVNRHINLAKRKGSRYHGMTKADTAVAKARKVRSGR